MAKSTRAKAKNTRSSSKKANPIQSKITSKENLQFFFGLSFIILGAFLTIAVFSYFSTWKHDQSAILSSANIFDYIFTSDKEVSNWGGKLGAALSHTLVYKGIGVMAIVFTVWLAAFGVNIFNGKKVIAIEKWLRWMALGFLFLCPLLALIFAKSEISYGGVLGNSLIGWSHGVAGLPGTIFMLVLVLFFFVVMVFQWDIKPWLNAVKSVIPTRKLAEDSPELATATASNDDYIAASNAGVSSLPASDDTHLADSEEEDDEDYVPFAGNTYTGALPELTIDIDTSLIKPDPNLDIRMEEKPTAKSKEKTNQGTLVPELNHVESSQVIDKNGISVEIPEVKKDAEIIIEEVENIPTSVQESGYENIENESNVHTAETKDPNAIESVPGLEVIKAKDEVVANLSGRDSVATLEPYAPELDLRDYKFPILDLLEDIPVENIALNADELKKNKDQITKTLKSFGIEISRIQATVGPTVTLYEIVPQEGVRISKIRNLEDDIALNLAALGIRMIAPIPGKGTIGIEVPNAKKQIVPMRSILSSAKFINNDMSLPIALGKKIDNENYIVDLASMPHLLMAGATGQGKSVGINAILVSLLYKKHPSQLKFVMIDPKKVELSVYRTIEKHYLAKLPNEEEPIITDTKKVINTLNSLCIEMDNRYELLKDAGTRNIKEYNAKFIKRSLNPEQGHKYLPFIVLIIDEFADLIMTAGKEVEMPVARLAQLARAIGIHLIVATQRPSVNVITGIIKANFPARIAFRVTSKVDSRTILDTGGADQLIGRGDMLVSHGSELLRLQCAFVDTPEVERIAEYIGNQRGYPTAFELPEYEGAEDEANERKDVDLSKRDKMFEECARLVVNSQSGSTSMLQRKFNLGYNRAGRIMDQLEAAGIVGGQVGSKPRDVMVTTEYELDNILNDLIA